MNREHEVSKWIRIPAGLLLGLLTLLCVLGSLTLLVSPPESNPLLGIVIGILLLVVCLWVLEKSACMVFGLRREKGLLAPGTLRVIAVLFLVLPLIGVFTGYYSNKGLIAVIKGVGSVGIFFALYRLARWRDSKGRRNDG